MPLPPHIHNIIHDLVLATFAPVQAAVTEGATGATLQESIKRHLSFEALDDLVYATMDRLRMEGRLSACDNAGDRNFRSVNLWNDFVANGLDPASPDFARTKSELSIMHLNRLGKILAGAGQPFSVVHVETKKEARDYVDEMQQSFVDFMTYGHIDRTTGGRDLVDCPFTDQRLAVDLQDWKMVVVDRNTAEPVEPHPETTPAPGM